MMAPPTLSSESRTEEWTINASGTDCSCGINHKCLDTSLNSFFINFSNNRGDCCVYVRNDWT
ncbi:hypothetical protein E2C01_026594 [Portunus trituberculatus]|uniref:Uncharacterized protein n=1 Tax=Portunus trituberculatus TaxID=210409 RepID=A0A5B7EFT1_PORTR|nr:hypothetical protein [Portunus trituberculatus]